MSNLQLKTETSSVKVLKHEGCKSYATYENAVKAGMAASEKSGRGTQLWLVIIAGTGKETGRFIPAFIGGDTNDMLHLGFSWIVKA